MRKDQRGHSKFNLILNTDCFSHVQGDMELLCSKNYVIISFVMLASLVVPCVVCLCKHSRNFIIL